MNANSEHIFMGGSEMAALMQTFASAESVANGSSASIGAIATWSPSFKTALNILLNACSPMFLVWGSDRFLFYNDAYSLLLRANNQPILVGQPVSDSWNETWQPIQTEVEQVFATGQPRRCENQLFPGDRSDKQRYYTWSYSPLWNEAGEIDGVFATGCRVLVEDSPPALSNLTPQDLEEALYRREEQLRLVTNALPALIAYVDKDHYYRFNNQAYETWFGQRPADLMNRHVGELLGEAAYTALLPYMEQALSGQRVSFESQISYQTGGTRYISADYVPHINNQGVVEGYFSLVSDITDRKQTENALRQSEERYRCLAESIPQLVWTANAEGVLLDINQRWINFTGLTLEQAQAEGWQAVIHPDDVARLTHDWAAAQQSDTRYQAEGRMRRADGVYRWHLHQAVPLKDAQGKILKWFGTATDIEEQKQLQQEREYLLQREQAARAEAEAANRVKDEFLAVLSHELRSPLNPILGWSRLLREGKLDETKTKHALATIERNAKLQADLIEDLLDVSRILRGKLSLAVSPVNLAATIRAAIETVRLAADAQSIQIETDLTPTQPVAGDATRLQQVMWNLLSNAVKFTPPGGRVKVKLEQVESKRVAQVTITDTGKGIAPNFLPYIFDYFRQADSATTRQFGGLGLGLAIVRHLVELHGGIIHAESKGEGLGATFTVRLPLLKDEDGGRKTETDPLHPSALRPHPLKLQFLRVLLVEDDSDTRDFVAFLLEQAGAKVTAIATAGEALAILKRSPPDILLSDIGMPEMDGYMLMRQVRTLPPEQGGLVKAIALTAYAGDFNQQQAIAAGFQQHMSKPIDPEMLIQAIATLTGTLPNRYHQDG